MCVRLGQVVFNVLMEVTAINTKEPYAAGRSRQNVGSLDIERGRT